MEYECCNVTQPTKLKEQKKKDLLTDLQNKLQFLNQLWKFIPISLTDDPI